MPLKILLFAALKAGIPIVINKLGQDICKRLFPPIEKARKSAVKKMADELSSEFPSTNFLELNFRFNSPAMKNELIKIRSGEKPDEITLKQEMAKEVSQKWPQYSSKAEKIVDSFIRHFEEQCLAIKELESFTLTSIIREEHTATKEVVRKESEETRDLFMTQLSEVKNEMVSFKQMISSTQETETPDLVTTTLEETLIHDRDNIQDLVKKWQSANLHKRIQELAEKTYKVRDKINPIISGSIFRLCGSFILRSFLDKEKAKYWIDLAEELEPENHKTIALKSELMCFEKRWSEAKQLLDPIVNSSNEPFAKIIYGESLSHTLGVKEAFEWLKKQKNVKDENEIQLNLAIFAVEIGDFEYALDIINKLKAKPYSGPYPYLLTAKILVKQALPRELISMSAPEDLELQKNKPLLKSAISNLEEGLKLLKNTSKPKTEIAYTAHNLSEVYLQLYDVPSAEKHLCEYWRYLRKDNNSWFTASSIVFHKGNKEKALFRAEMALTLSKESDYDAFIRFTLLCVNMGEWDRCLDNINIVKGKDLNEVQLKAILQMELVCYFQKGDIKHAESSIEILKTKFPKDEMWVIHRSLMLAQQKKVDDAISLLIEESRNHPDSIKIKLRLSSLYRQEKKYSNALPLYKEIANLLGSIGSFENACVVAFEAAKPDEVLVIINDAANHGITSENLNHYKAIAFAMKEQYAKALELFNAFHAHSLTSNDFIFFALCCSKRANPQKSIDLLNSAKAKFPDDIRINRTLYFLYLEINKPEMAFEEAKICLEKAPDDKAGYLAVITTGFTMGDQDTAYRTMMEYLTRFGEGPGLRAVQIEDVKELRKVRMEHTELLWKKYQDGLIPETMLSNRNAFGIGGGRMMLLNSPAKVMAFDGHPDSQKRQLFDTVSGQELLVDYHALITLYLLGLMEPTIDLFKIINIPQFVLDEINSDLHKLPTSFQKDRRAIHEGIFSKLNDFEIHQTFPHINLKDISGTIGNTTYDLLVCKDKKCSFVTPGFESKELSDIKSIFDIDVISILDITDYLKEKGIITVKEHAEVVKKLKRHKLQRLFSSKPIPECLMFDWNVLEMLEEYNFIQHISKFVKEKHVGPFSYSVIRSEIDKYKAIDDIQRNLINIENNISKLIEENKVKIVSSKEEEKTIEADASSPSKSLKYITDIKNIALGKKFVLWSDDLCLNGLSAAEDIKTTCTRTILDILLDREIITKEVFVRKVVQLLKWNMYFCWVNVDLIMNCAEMYNYTSSENIKIIISAIIDEIKTYPNQLPHEIEQSNFNVVSLCIQKLWLIPGKAQSLAMNIFDEVHLAVKLKDILHIFWISQIIIGFAKLGEIPLAEFLKMLSLRMPEQLEDTLKDVLRILINVSLKSRSDRLIQVANTKIIGANIIKAVGIAVPGYERELTDFALKLDASIKTLIKR